jgi:hypothetical protein
MEPSSFDTGQYDLRGYTYGYVQRTPASVYGQRTQIIDIRINLIIGVNITLDVLFKKESIITGTPANMSGRIRIFNDQGLLVGEWMTSEGTFVTGNGFSRAADGTNGYPFGPMGIEDTGECSQLGMNINRCLLAPTSGDPDFNFIPGGTTLLHAVIAGLPQVPAGGDQVPFYVPSGYYMGDAVFTHSALFCNFAVYCVAFGGYPYPNTGVLGSPDYQGGWTAEVDFVPWYANNTGTMELASGGGQTASPTTFGQYYPPVTGLLMGESYHIIPGTTAKSGISLVEDTALAEPPTFLGHSMALNHLGPYSQRGVWQISNAHLSGEASGIFEVDLNGLVAGNVLAFTWSSEFRTLSWGTISVTGAPGGATWNFYTYDGVYQAFLPTGNYKFTISQPGYAPQTWSVSVSPGQTGTGQNVYLEQSNIPVPEFSGIGAVAFSALAASLYLLKRKRK